MDTLERPAHADQMRLARVLLVVASSLFGFLWSPPVAGASARHRHVCNCPVIPLGELTVPGAPPCRCPVAAARSATPAVIVTVHQWTAFGSSFTTTTGLTVYIEPGAYFVWRAGVEIEWITRPSSATSVSRRGADG